MRASASLDQPVRRGRHSKCEPGVLSFFRYAAWRTASPGAAAASFSSDCSCRCCAKRVKNGRAPVASGSGEGNGAAPPRPRAATAVIAWRAGANSGEDSAGSPLRHRCRRIAEAPTLLPDISRDAAVITTCTTPDGPRGRALDTARRRRGAGVPAAAAAAAAARSITVPAPGACTPFAWVYVSSAASDSKMREKRAGGRWPLQQVWRAASRRCSGCWQPSRAAVTGF